MNTHRSILILTILVLIAGGLAGCSSVNSPEIATSVQAAPAAVPASTTLENLQAAYNGESNANAKYLAFAKKADEEGYGKVASLFRAAARAEEIHVINHAKVIRAFGADPKADIKPVEVGTTAENLKAAIAGETYERDTMYPEFIAESKKSRSDQATRTFNFALAAEAEHAKLYTEALANLEKWKGDAMNFYVCPMCGFTTPDANLKICPVDYTKFEKFEVIK